VVLAVGVPGAGAQGRAAGSADPLATVVAHAKRATAPFRGLTATRVRVGDEELDVVVADEFDERVQGLRRRRDLGPYDGMLFAFEGPTITSFTMSTVPVPLDIGFYGARGRVVDRLRMRPCAGDESECPLYRPSGAFSYALETLRGDLPRGRLRPA